MAQLVWTPRILADLRRVRVLHRVEGKTVYLLRVRHTSENWLSR